jgi:hypothetical protein
MKCNSKLPKDQKTIDAFAQGSTYSKERLHAFVALWSASSYRPFTIAEDPYFVRIVGMFNPEAVKALPSDTTVSRSVMEFYAIGKENVKQYLKVRSTLR